MAEFTGVALQTVEAGQNVIFTETPVKSCNCNIMHRQGSGIVTLRGGQNQCARYKISFGGNIAVPTGQTVGAISLAIAVSGEPLSSATMVVTPAAVEQFFNVFGAVYITVPCDCCVTVAVENTSTIPVNVQNANLIVDRKC